MSVVHETLMTIHFLSLATFVSLLVLVLTHSFFLQGYKLVDFMPATLFTASSIGWGSRRVAKD